MEIVKKIVGERPSRVVFKSAVSVVLVLLMVLSLLGGCAGTPDGSAPNSTPLMWQVTSPDGQTMYLFGSIHAAGEELYPLPTAVTKAFDRCDALAVEVDMVAFETDMKAQMDMTQRLMYPSGQTIADEIGDELYEKAKSVLVQLEPELKLGFPLDMMDNFKPFMWESLLTSVSIERAGLSAEHGLDMYFLKSAKERDIEIIEVESMDEQLDIMLGFSGPVNAYLLEGLLDVEGAALELKELYSLWKQGDALMIEEFLDSDFEGMPEELVDEYKDSFMTQRNLKMAEAAEQYMTEGKTVFYVVGLAHLLGEDGLVELLKHSGYTLERINP